MSSTREPAIGAALERLRLSAEVQDVTGSLKFARMRGQPERERRVRRILSTLRERRRRAAPPTLVDAALEHALKLAAFGRRGWLTPAIETGSQTPRRRTEREPVAGYVTSSAGEEQVVRLSLLLRLMKRQRDAVDLLIARVQSGLAADQSRVWLAHFLEEAGEKKAAALLLADVPSAAPAPRAIASGPRSRLRYGVVMLTMFDSDVFRSSLTSLARSDFDGRIVVVEDGYEPEAVCRSFCESLPVTYLKQSSWKGSAAAMNAGIAAVADECDVVTFVHNDVLWPPSWFRWFDNAWGATYASGRLGLLNLGYVQFKHKLDTALSKLFLRGDYAHLQWLLRAYAEVPSMKTDRVQHSEVRAGEALFGMARDPWNDWVPDARFMTGRFSVTASFPSRVWRAMGCFDENIPYGFDLELQHHCLSTRQWMLFANNPPLIHLASSDTRVVDPARRAQARDLHQTYEVFEQRYGSQIEHFINLYFSETAFIHQDAIVRAANELRFDEIDYVFDDFERRLRERTLDTCELTWCRSRSSCKYTTPAAAVAAAKFMTAAEDGRG